MKIVLDTNVFIALALRGEFTEDLFEFIIKSPDIILTVSEEIFQELSDKLREKFHWNEADIKLFISKLPEILMIIKFWNVPFLEKQI